MLGSGASSGVPWLACVLEDPAAGLAGGGCAVCAEALRDARSPNRRGNVSCALRFARPDGGAAGLYTVVVDCGKTFRDTVTRVWPRLAPPLRGLQALLLTHPHADAFGGLDCLREASPSSPVHVYCHAPTMRRIEQVYPYLVPSAAGAGAAAGSAAGAGAAAGSAGGSGQAPMPRTYVADLIFHVVTPWVPFELAGSGGLVVTPIPLEHSGRFGAPGFCEEDVCLGFEFGCFLPGSSSGGAPAELQQHEPAAAAAEAAALPLDARGLPALPAFSGDRILWLSDVRALSAEVRAFLAARPVTLLCIDALGHKLFPTHFNLAQAVACAVDLVGPGSATAAAAAPVDVQLVGMNHDVFHEGECAKLEGVRASARVARPACGARPFVWEGAPCAEAGAGAGAGAAPGEPALVFEPLGLASLALAHDGASRAVRIAQPLRSLAALARDIEAVRCAARALSSSDAAFDYLAAATAASACMRQASAAHPPLGEAHLPPAGGPRLALRQREDYLSALPPAYAGGYEGSPSQAKRGAWVYEGRRL